MVAPGIDSRLAARQKQRAGIVMKLGGRLTEVVILLFLSAACCVYAGEGACLFMVGAMRRGYAVLAARRCALIAQPPPPPLSALDVASGYVQSKAHLIPQFYVVSDVVT